MGFLFVFGSLSLLEGALQWFYHWLQSTVALGRDPPRAARRVSAAAATNHQLPDPLDPPPHTHALQARDTKLRGAGGPRCHFFSTFFLAKLLSLQVVGPKRGTYEYKEVRGRGTPHGGLDLGLSL